MTISKARAIAIFGKNDLGGIDWPYGVAHVRNPQWSPEEYRAHLKDRDEAKELVFDWAQRYGLKKTDKGCCPVWLQQDRNSRCSGRRVCARFGGSGVRDCDWMEHTALWTFDRQPVAITSAPYDIGQRDRAELDRWVEEDPRLAVAFGGTGWYGHGTFQIILWRTDLVDIIDPA